MNLNDPERPHTHAGEYYCFDIERGSLVQPSHYLPPNHSGHKHSHVPTPTPAVRTSLYTEVTPLLALGL